MRPLLVPFLLLISACPSPVWAQGVGSTGGMPIPPPIHATFACMATLGSSDANYGLRRFFRINDQKTVMNLVNDSEWRAWEAYDLRNRAGTIVKPALEQVSQMLKSFTFRVDVAMELPGEPSLQGMIILSTEVDGKTVEAFGTSVTGMTDRLLSVQTTLRSYQPQRYMDTFEAASASVLCFRQGLSDSPKELNYIERRVLELFPDLR